MTKNSWLNLIDSQGNLLLTKPHHIQAIWAPTQGLVTIYLNNIAFPLSHTLKELLELISNYNSDVSK